jgi:shikimate kinase
LATSNRNIVITGFMGTGKSSVGKLIAEMTERDFVDTDEVIVTSAGMSIPEIFQREGEPGFRLRERRFCRFFAAQTGLVIATGGGMLVDEGNRNVMLASGLVVCLDATTEAIEARVGGDANRPLLNGDWRGLLERRRTAYAAIPNHVDTTGKTPELIAQEIVELWQKLSK